MAHPPHFVMRAITPRFDRESFNFSAILIKKKNTFFDQRFENKLNFRLIDSQILLKVRYFVLQILVLLLPFCSSYLINIIFVFRPENIYKFHV